MERYSVYSSFLLCCCCIAICNAKQRDESVQQLFARFAQEKQALQEMLAHEQERHVADQQGAYYVLRMARDPQELFRARVAVFQLPEFSRRVRAVLDAGKQYVSRRLAQISDKTIAEKPLPESWRMDFVYFVALTSPQGADALVKGVNSSWSDILAHEHLFWTPKQLFQQSAIIDLLH